MATYPVTLNRGLERGYGDWEPSNFTYPVTLNRGLERGYGSWEPINFTYPATNNRGLERGYGSIDTAVDRAQLPLGLIFFKMRAYKTSVPVGHVYWDVPVEPDPTGALAPYPSADLVDIVVEAIFEKDD